MRSTSNDHLHAHGDYVHRHPHGSRPRCHGHAEAHTPLARLDRSGLGGSRSISGCDPSRSAS